MIETAIVGGGPAGSYCAYCLAKNDIYPVIFDHTHPREKPCGGLISPLAQKLFPFLKELPIEHGERNRIYLIPPSGKQICIRLRKSKMLGVSRSKLDQFLVNMAANKGAKLIKEKVIALKRKKDLWEVKTARESYLVRTLIGADGVNSLVRRNITKPLGKTDMGVCYGYLVRGLEKEDVTLRFLSHGKGYIWVIPRKEHTSLGISCTEISYSHGLERELDMFIAQHYPYVKKISKWAALIPNIKDVKTFRVPLAGPNWILIGDAAGHVNPISGEGIVYALLDGELAAQAVFEDNPRLFDKLWREVYGWSLFTSIKLRKCISKKTMLGFYCRYLKFQSIIQL